MTWGTTRQRLVRGLLKAFRHQRRGFTLIELLVSIIISSIIVSALLYLVTELNRFNGREELLTDTQQNMRRALDFMVSDVSEAVYVYSSPPADIIDNQLQPDGSFPAAAEATPILAFWRLDPVDTDGLDCDAVAAAKQDECTTLLIRHSAYTLVVYLQNNNDVDDIWQGPSRIIRYELSKYTDVSNLDQRAGYQDPTLDANNFADWEANGTPEGVAQVLTDHVAAPQSLATADVAACPATATFERTPADSNTFYTCIQSGAAAVGSNNADEEILNRTNQSLLISLTGNAARTTDGSGDILVGNSGQAGRLPSLQAEVLVRGVIEKPR